MAPWLDARIPVLVGADPAPGDAALMEDGAPPPGAGIPSAAFTADGEPPHPVGCACCTARSGAALALDRLFLGRARGTLPFFRRVVAVTATAAGEASVRAALAGDPVVAARYRPGGLSA